MGIVLKLKVYQQLTKSYGQCDNVHIIICVIKKEFLKRLITVNEK